MQKQKNTSNVLALIVLAQFFCTSVWFAGNAVLLSLIENFNFPPSAFGHITSAVQLGFISGTLLFGFMTIADRFSPSKVFFYSAIGAAFANVALLMAGGQLSVVLFLRFLTGFFLAGIYPVGMKIAADYFDQGLGKALGFLVGALVLGTAFPHLIKSWSAALSWQPVFIGTSILSLIGGVLILVFVADGPFRKKSQGLQPRAIFKVFRSRAFRAGSFGYFGHMWELYTFWAFVPVILANYQQKNGVLDLNISFWSFVIIGGGSLACMGSGLLSQRFGAQKTAFAALSLSGLCCLLSPLMWWLSLPLFLIFLIFWGLVVVADSPMFSTLVAQSAPAETKGTALTIVNCIGFSITIISVEWMTHLQQGAIFSDALFMILAIGPILGLISLVRYGK